MRRSARVAAAVLAAGCADRRQALAPPAAAPDFRAGCGDVLAVRFAGRPGWDGTASVGVDGTLPLGPLGSVAADRQSLAEIQQAAAMAARLPPDAVAVALVGPRAGVVYLSAGGRLRAVPHLGPEAVNDFLWRAGLTEVGAVRVTRPDPAGGPPRTFAAGLGEMVEAGDTVTAGR